MAGVSRWYVERVIAASDRYGMALANLYFFTNGWLSPDAAYQSAVEAKHAYDYLVEVLESE